MYHIEVEKCCLDLCWQRGVKRNMSATIGIYVFLQSQWVKVKKPTMWTSNMWAGNDMENKGPIKLRLHTHLHTLVSRIPQHTLFLCLPTSSLLALWHSKFVCLLCNASNFETTWQFVTNHPREIRFSKSSTKWQVLFQVFLGMFSFSSHNGCMFDASHPETKTMGCIPSCVSCAVPNVGIKSMENLFARPSNARVKFEEERLLPIPAAGVFNDEAAFDPRLYLVHAMRDTIPWGCWIIDLGHAVFYRQLVVLWTMKISQCCSKILKNEACTMIGTYTFQSDAGKTRKGTKLLAWWPSRKYKQQHHVFAVCCFPTDLKLKEESSHLVLRREALNL